MGPQKFLSEGAKEVLFLRQLLDSMFSAETKATVLWEYNAGAIFTAGQAMTTARAKDIDIRLHFVRDLVQDGTIPVRKFQQASRPPIC